MKKLVILSLASLCLGAFAANKPLSDKTLINSMPEKAWTQIEKNSDSDNALMMSSRFDNFDEISMLGRSRAIHQGIVTHTEYVRMFVKDFECKKGKGFMTVIDLSESEQDSHVEYDFSQKETGSRLLLQNVAKTICKGQIQ